MAQTSFSVTQGSGTSFSSFTDGNSLRHQSVTQGGATAATNNVTAAATSQQLSAANDGRRFWSIFNDSTAVCYLKFGTTASTTSFTVKLDAGAYYEMPPNLYAGRIDAIWSSATGTGRVTEVTP